MKKQEWQKLYNILDSTHYEFLIAYPTYKNGKNEKIRRDAEREMDNAISLAKYHIEDNWEAFKLLTGGEETSGFGRAVIRDEFFMPRYFGNDMRDFLHAIQEKIRSLED